MIVVADESVDLAIIIALRGDGHDVTDIAEAFPGSKDDEVLQKANDRTALLVTADKDFGELVFRQKQVHAGVLLVRLGGLSGDEKATIVCEALRHYGPQLIGAFSVLSPRSLRIRP